MQEPRQNVYRSMVESTGGMAVFPHGVSMRPLIRQGEGCVTVVKVAEPQPGDLLLFEESRRGGKVNLIHRLIEVRPDGIYVCRGDNCRNCEHIRREDIIGRADRIVWTKDAGHLMPWLLGAEPDPNNEGARSISVNAPGYLRYVSLWNAIWPLRSIIYSVRDLNIGRRIIWHLCHKTSKTTASKQ